MEEYALVEQNALTFSLYSIKRRRFLVFCCCCCLVFGLVFCVCVRCLFHLCFSVICLQNTAHTRLIHKFGTPPSFINLEPHPHPIPLLSWTKQESICLFIYFFRQDCKYGLLNSVARPRKAAHFFQEIKLRR